MAPRKVFRHMPLSFETDQIRLIQIRPGPDNVVQCSLQHYNHAACPPYKALSYTWGKPYPTRDILIDGARFSARENLWHFLRTVAPDGNEFFWIDQICVDQQNIEERNHQVEFMGDIYHQASEVIIWLGTSEKGSADAMDFILSVQAHNLEKSRDQSCAVGINFCSPFLALSAVCRTFDLASAPVTALRLLFRKAYWSRVWVIQEIMLARRLLLKYGDRTIRWEDLQEFKVWCKENGNLRLGHCQESPSCLIPPTVKTLINNKLQWGLGETWKAPSHDLRYVLSTYTKSECEDVRDKVYGLQGLVVFGARVPVDYDKKLHDLTRDVLSVLAKETFREYDLKAQRALDEFAILLAQSLQVLNLPGVIHGFVYEMVHSRSEDFSSYNAKAVKDLEKLHGF